MRTPRLTNYVMDYSVEVYEGCRPSFLRGELERAEGKFAKRRVDLNKVDPSEIVDLDKRPAYSPSITIFQIKQLPSGIYHVFTEDIYTSNEFVDGFEKFLREYAIDVQAENIEDVPESHRNYFDTPFTLVCVDMESVKASVTFPNGDYRSIEIDTKIKGVDFTTPFTFRMVEPEAIDRKLSEVESRGTFSVYVREMMEGGGIHGRLLAFEHRRGSEHVGDHIVARSKFEGGSA